MNPSNSPYTTEYNLHNIKYHIKKRSLEPYWILSTYQLNKDNLKNKKAFFKAKKKLIYIQRRRIKVPILYQSILKNKHIMFSVKNGFYRTHEITQHSLKLIHKLHIKKLKTIAKSINKLMPQFLLTNKKAW